MGIDNFLKGVSPFPLFDYEAIFWALAKNKNLCPEIRPGLKKSISKFTSSCTGTVGKHSTQGH